MFKDIWMFLKNISFVDYMFFFTVVFLIILVVSLVYFIKINETEIEVEESEDKKKELKTEPVVTPKKDSDNLQKITESLLSEEQKPVKFTSYEEEQEEKAIISYDELLGATGEYQINYVDDPKPNTDVDVKKVDLKNMVNLNTKVEPPKMTIRVISLEEEEAFLKALKQLQKNLQ